MNLSSFFCFLTCAIILGLMARKGADVFSPGKVFGFIWCLVIGLAELKLSVLQHQWSLESWLAVLLGPFSFLAGIYTVYVLNMNRQLVHIDGVRSAWRESPIDVKLLFKLITVAFVLFLVGYGVIVLSGREIPLLSSRPGRARLQFQIFGLGLFLHNAVWIGFFSVVYHIRVQGEALRKSALVGMTLASLILYAITLQRFLIIMVVVLSFVFLYYSTHRIRFSYVLGFIISSVLFFYWISTLRGGQLFISYIYTESRMKFPLAYAVFTEPYMYFAMNVENFARSVDKMESFSGGFFTFDFVAALTGLKHWVSSYFGLQNTPFLISGYNTYTAFWTYYRDFGVLGLILIPFPLGTLVAKAYFTMRTNPSVVSIAVYCLCIFTVIFSFFHSLISFLWYVYTLAGMVAILKLTRVAPERIPP